MKVVFLSMFILFAFTPASAQETPGSIEGVIRDLSRAPVSDASVYAYDYYNFRTRINTTADSNGRFVLRDLPPGTYSVHAYKESDGYPDTFFSFFDVGNHNAWRREQVQAGHMTNVDLELGPKYAVLKLSIMDKKGNPLGGSIDFTRGKPGVSNPEFSTGYRPEILVPPVPFRFRIKAEGYRIWSSKLLSPRSGGIVSLTVRLIKN